MVHTKAYIDDDDNDDDDDDDDEYFCERLLFSHSKKKQLKKMCNKKIGVQKKNHTFFSLSHYISALCVSNHPKARGRTSPKHHHHHHHHFETSACAT